MPVTYVSCQDILSPISQPTSHIPREQLNIPLDDKLPSTVAAGDINRRPILPSHPLNPMFKMAGTDQKMIGLAEERDELYWFLMPDDEPYLGENTSISVAGSTHMHTTTQLPGSVQGGVEENSMCGDISSSLDNAHFLGNFSSPKDNYSLSPECQQIGDHFGVKNSTSSYMSSNGQDDMIPYGSSSPAHDGEPTHDGEPADDGGPMCSDDSHSQSLVQPHNVEVVPTLRRSTHHGVPPSYLKD
nr:hypothetical protein Iba_chr14bCG13750 [Ipomoea batatas]